MKLPIALALAAGGVVLALASAGAQDKSTAYVWRLPKGFPKPAVPADNPMNAEKVELGRHLFYDKRLSGNGKQACRLLPQTGDGLCRRHADEPWVDG